MYNIEWDKLKNKHNIKIIDIRNRNKYLLGHVDNSINICEEELYNYPNRYLRKDEIYYIYCDYGNRSKIIVSKLNSLGYNAVNINGGYHNYLLRG